MNDNKHLSAAVIAAAGASLRMNCGINKNYMEILGEAVLSTTLRAFCVCPLIDEIVVVYREGELSEAKSAAAEAAKVKKIIFTQGGATRQASVYNGLCSVSEGVKYVAVHDGARPLVTPDMISQVLKSAYENKAACAAVRVNDTCAMLNEQNDNPLIGAYLNRQKLCLLQTPQCFEIELIRKAHEAAKAEGFNATDDTALVRKYGAEVNIVFTHEENMKITSFEDIYTAQSILKLRLS